MKTLAFLLLVLVPLPASAKLEVPYLAGRVTDQANVIPAETRAQIEQKLEAFEARTGAQVAVLTVESLEGEPIETYALRVAQTWKLGQEGKDNGLLLLVAHGDRRMRMEVGYGLEADLTDLETNIIQNEVIIPHFKQGDFGGGIAAGVDAILAALEGQEVKPAESARPSGSGGGGPWIFSLFLAFVLWPFARAAAYSGSWIFYIFLMPFAFFLGLPLSAPWGGVITLLLWVVGFPILRAVLPKRPRGGGGFRGGGGWFPMGGGGGWSSGGGGWSSGGGGFSGGGGSFGGGGSSSSW